MNPWYQNLSDLEKQQYRQNRVQQTKRLKWYTNGETAIRLKPWDPIPTGFYLGRSDKYKKSISEVAQERRDNHPETRLFVRNENNAS